MKNRRSRQRAQYYKRRAQYTPPNCGKCAGPGPLELDHKIPADKTSHRIWTWSTARLEAELSKCQWLCAQCHRQKTNDEIRVDTPHGTMSRYTNPRWRCRCVACREANAMYKKNYRRRAGPA